MRKSLAFAALAAVFLATFALPFGMRFAHAQVPQPEFQVIGARCEAGHVTGVRIAVSGPGLVQLAWDNAKVCGASI